MKLWPWSRKTEEVCEEAACPVGPSPEALQALHDSVLIKETAEYRWPRVDAVANRIEATGHLVQSQRDQNHLGELAWKALHAKYGGSPA